MQGDHLSFKTEAWGIEAAAKELGLISSRLTEITSLAITTRNALLDSSENIDISHPIETTPSHADRRKRKHEMGLQYWQI